MSKAFALTHWESVDLPAPLAGSDASLPLSRTENAQCASAGELDRLYASLDNVTPESHPRTAKLLLSGTRKSAQKVIEEAGEVALEAAKHHSLGVVRESADLLYHLVILWRRAGIEPAEVWDEMRRRAGTHGVAEKLPKVRPPQHPQPLSFVESQDDPSLSSTNRTAS
jgi:phosphoribosyl-ATP pyrophosphohydrolase